MTTVLWILFDYWPITLMVIGCVYVSIHELLDLLRAARFGNWNCAIKSLAWLLVWFIALGLLVGFVVFMYFGTLVVEGFHPS